MSVHKHHSERELSVECASLPLSHRKHSPDRGPCLFPGGLHSPDARPESPKLQGLCPSCPKGQSAPLLFTFYPLRISFSLITISSVCFFCADSLLGFLCMWRNGRDGGVAVDWSTHHASDTWTQSQFQLEGDANTRLRDALFVFQLPWTAEKVFIF